MLVDRTEVFLRSGKGGDGCESYECRGYKKFFPIGGDGGKGGDIIIRGDNNLSNLDYYLFNPRQIAQSGQPGSGNKKTGAQGKDLVLRVPPGTKVFSKEDGYLLREINESYDEFTVLQGGWPGRGNHDNKTHSKGQAGQELTVVFDYSIPSDAAFVGMPNSGKTSLLGALTRAKVKEAAYPFSSTLPQLGSLKCDDYTRRVLCDLPSLMEGSTEGKGLGTRFLKHAVSSKNIIIVIEPRSDFSTSLYESFKVVTQELSAYSEKFTEKEYIVVINKWEQAVRDGAEEDLAKIKTCCKHVFPVSVKTGENIDLLKERLQSLL